MSDERKPLEMGDLIMRLVTAEAAVVGMRRCLRRLIAAEKEFSRDTGIKLDDLISEAVASAELVLEHYKHIGADKPPAAESRKPE